DHFGTHGFEGSSTHSIAKQAGVTQPLLLYHFSSKDQLWRVAIAEAIQSYLAPMRDCIEQHRDRPASEAIKSFVDLFVRTAAQAPQMFRALSSTDSQGTERMRWLIENHTLAHYKRVTGLLRRGQKEGCVRRGDV